MYGNKNRSQGEYALTAENQQFLTDIYSGQPGTKVIGAVKGGA